MTDLLTKKTAHLKDILRKMEKVLIAYSGGVDSTYLLRMAIDTLGADKVLAVIAASETYPEHERLEAVGLCEALCANYLLIQTEEINDERFRSNPKERCYFCKRELFTRLKKIAEENGIEQIADGSNADDLKDCRPGARAKNELGIRSPLQEAGLTKAEIRSHSKELGLTTWDKPSYACLASRIPYGTEIKPETLKRIENAEGFLRELGFGQLRVRDHGNLARIELEPNDIHRIMNNRNMDQINRQFERLGYFYVTLDLKGYRTGSLNEVL